MAILGQGGTYTASDVALKLRIVASYLPTKSLHFGTHPETTP